MTESDQPRGRRPLVIVIAAVVAVAAMVAVIAFWPGDDDTAAKPANTPPKPTLTPLRIGEQPLWELPSHMDFLEQREGVVAYSHDDSTLTVADLATGKARVTVARMQNLGDAQYSQTIWGGDGLRHLVGSGADLGVVVEYYNYTTCRNGFCDQRPEDESGLALLSATDGHLVWRTPVMPSYPDAPFESRPSQVLRAVTDRVAVVAMLRGPTPDHADGVLRTVGIDVRTGEQLWERTDGLWPTSAAGETVLGNVWPQGATTFDVMATDAATGKDRWTHPGTLLATAGEVALIKNDRGVETVDAKSGRSIDHLDRLPDTCGTDKRSLMACAFPANDGTSAKKLAVMTTDGRITSVDREVAEVISVEDGGRIVVESGRGEDPLGQVYSVDSAGTVIDRHLDDHGRLMLLSGDKAVFSVDSRDVGVFSIS